MKRILQLFALCTSCFLTSSLTYASNNLDKNKPIIEKPIEVKDEYIVQRSLGTPIYAYYAAGTITLDFVENLGAVTVAIQNLTAGGLVVELIDTGMGTSTIDINSILTVGDYYMTITTMSGDVYYAEFTLE